MFLLLNDSDAPTLKRRAQNAKHWRKERAVKEFQSCVDDNPLILAFIL